MHTFRLKIANMKQRHNKKEWKKPEIIDLDAGESENQTGGPNPEGTTASPPNNRTS